MLKHSRYRYQIFFKGVSRFLHIDWFLLAAVLIVCGYGLIILYSASNESLDLVIRQSLRLGIALVIMFFLAQFPPNAYRFWGPWLFLTSLILLTGVLALGVVGKGAQRWLNLWLFQFQPSELMKLSVPMMIAWFLNDKPLPPTFLQLMIVLSIILIPALLIAKQPDLGTAMLICIAGFSVILIAGIRTRILLLALIIIIAITPLAWHFMHTYQRERILIFLNPERDPLGAGYHIIQSKIAIGAGGIFGQGWLHGSQSHLQFLPEHATDFIFAVCGEEFGLWGGLLLIALYTWIFVQGIFISIRAQDTFSRLLAGGLSFSFFAAAFVNIAMVCGILPVVGVPLPMISYGGTSLITFGAVFGILMSICTHRKLIGT